MGAFIDISLPVGGIIITLLRFFQVAILLSNNYIDISCSIHRFGIHLHFVMEENNRCREIENHKKQ